MLLPFRFLFIFFAVPLLLSVCFPLPRGSQRQTDQNFYTPSPLTFDQKAFLPLVQKDHFSNPPLYMANYAYPQDFAELAQRGINTILTDLSSEGSDWSSTYQAALTHNLKLIPLIWGDDQTIWAWNVQTREWELDAKKYPNSTPEPLFQLHPLAGRLSL